MTVYVDDMKVSFGRMIMCHMVADTTAELFAMVDKIGVARKWIQHPGTSQEHFDIALSKRALAVQHGVIEITWRQFGCMIARRVATGSLGDPLTAEDWMRSQIQLRRKKG